MTIELSKAREDYGERSEVEVKKEGNGGGWIEKTQENAKGAEKSWRIHVSVSSGKIYESG